MAPTPLSGAGQVFSDLINTLASQMPGARPLNATQVPSNTTDGSMPSAALNTADLLDSLNSTGLLNGTSLSNATIEIEIEVIPSDSLHFFGRRDIGSDIGSWIWIVIILAILVGAALTWRPIRDCVRKGKRSKAARAGPILGQGSTSRARGEGQLFSQHHRVTAPQHARYAPRGAPKNPTFQVRGGGTDYVAKVQREQHETDAYMAMVRSQDADEQQVKKEARQQESMQRIYGDGRQWPGYHA